MAYTQTDLDSVRAARLRGVRTVQFADRTVTYTSDAEMRQVEQDIQRGLAVAKPRAKQFRVCASKGL